MFHVLVTKQTFLRAGSAAQEDCHILIFHVLNYFLTPDIFFAPETMVSCQIASARCQYFWDLQQVEKTETKTLHSIEVEADSNAIKFHNTHRSVKSLESESWFYCAKFSAVKLQGKEWANGHLLVDSVDLSVLLLDLAAHVDGHVSQVGDHAGHLRHVLFHLVLARVLCDPDTNRPHTFSSEDEKTLFWFTHILMILPFTYLIIWFCR